MYCKRCQQFQDDIGTLIHQNRLADEVNYAAVVADVDGNKDANAAPSNALASSEYWPSHELVLFSDLEELRAAFNSSCPLCRRVFRCIDRGDWATLKTYKSVIAVLIFGEKEGKPTLKARFDTIPPINTLQWDKKPSKSSRNLSHLGEFLEGLEDDDPLLETLECCAGLDNSSTGSTGSFEMAAFWLYECLLSHPNCTRDTSGWLPTRLIDVGDADCESAPRLVETANLSTPDLEPPNAVAFLALSHCWGAKQIITTTTSTLADRKRGIDFQTLSKTFQDAVITTRKLGQRYLWIDSLCIIQDSVEDWMAESVQMSTIYERALFTIMAAHASGGDEGCFVRRDGLAQLPFTLRFSSPDKTYTQVACFQLPDHGKKLRPRYSPVLFTRAWVLQEQFNSRARLIFFGEQVHWECRTMSGSEQRPLDGKRIWDVISGPGSLAVDEESVPRGSVGDLHHGMKWYELVRNFTRRGITKSSDRLIALDGIAQSLQKRTSDRYIAGLWLGGLPTGLMWYIPWELTKSGPWHALEKETKIYLSSRHKQVLAPTWSWASVTFPVDWFSLYNERITMVCNVLQADAQGTPFNTYGTVILRGMTRRLFVEPYYQSLHFTGTCTENPKTKGISVINMKDEDKWRTYICYASKSKPCWRHKLAPFPIEFLPDEIFDYTQPVTFIALGYSPCVDMHKGSMRNFRNMSLIASRRSIFTLALQPAAEGPDTFRRVGFATWNNCSWFGYFCVSEVHKLEILLRLLQIQEAKGSVAMLRELPGLFLVWIWGSLLKRSIMQFHEMGPVWFRELTCGNGGKHKHEGDIRSKGTYRESWEAEERTIRIV